MATGIFGCIHFLARTPSHWSVICYGHFDRASDRESIRTEEWGCGQRRLAQRGCARVPVSRMRRSGIDSCLADDGGLLALRHELRTDGRADSAGTAITRTKNATSRDAAKTRSAIEASGKACRPGSATSAG